MTDDNNIDNLIAKYLAGEATQQEHQMLRQWMDTSEENKKYFGDILFVHDQTVASYKYIKVNTENAWSKVKGQMKSTKPIEVPKTKAIRQMSWTKIAATLALVIGCASLFYVLLTHQNKGENISYSLVANDTIINHAFSENTRVVLNRNSKITFKQYKREKRKELTITGEAFIQVTQKSDTPLIVKADETLIRDIGTAFNVKANPGSQTIEVFVEDGEVAFYTEKLRGIIINKGETGVFDKNTKTFRKIMVSSPNIVSYKTHRFVFTHTRLADAIEKLNSVYNKSVVLGNPNLSDCAITVTFDNENIEAIVDIISETLGLQVIKNENGYILNGDHCLSQ